MKLIKEESRYVILNTHEIKSDGELADLLIYFLSEGASIIFSYLDTDYFFKHLDEQDQKTQDFINKVIEFNKINYGSEVIFLEGKEEYEKRKFINERTVFVNKISGVPFSYSNYYHRQIIWFKTLNKSEIIKAIRMDYLFS